MEVEILNKSIQVHEAKGYEQSNTQLSISSNPIFSPSNFFLQLLIFLEPTYAQYLYMITSLLLTFAVMAGMLTLMLVCVCAASCMGLLGCIIPLLLRILALFHDKPYTQSQEPINNECFICIERITDEVVATCNHSFCGQCITRYIQSKEWQSISCPACRKEVLVLFRRFQAKTDRQREIKTKISEYNYKYTREPGFFRAVLEFGNTLRHIPLLLSQNGIRFILTDARFKYVILLIIYALSPVDLLPEAVLGPFGLIDDGVAVAGLLRQVSVLLYSFIREESRR